MSQKFFRFDEADLDALIEANLTTKEIHLWLYFCLLDPFGDRPVEIPPYEVIEQKLKIKKSTYYSAKAKLQELGLWDFIEKKTVALNLRGHVRTNVLNSEKLKSSPENQTPVLKIGIQSEKLESSPKNWNPVLKIGIQSEKSENESQKPLPVNHSGLPQTIQTFSDYSDLSEDLKDDRNIKDRQDNGLIKENVEKDERLIKEDVEEDNGLMKKDIEKQEDDKLIKEESLPVSPCTGEWTFAPTDDERLKNEEFIRYAQGKLPKARDIKRYLLTNDKTTGDRILNKFWLEYQQWKTGKTNTPNSTGSEYFDNLIEEYRKIKPWEGKFNWEKVDWTKLPCFDLWLNKARNCKVDYTFIEDNGLGFNRNLRTVFFRWFEQEGNKECFPSTTLRTGDYAHQPQTTGSDAEGTLRTQEISESTQGIGLIHAFKQIVGGGVNYAY